MLEEILSLINRRERQILAHSFLYYQLSENIISDATFDLWSKELVNLMEQYPEEFAQSVYAKEFAEFDGCSGYDLPYSMPDVQNTGYRLLKYHKKMKQKKG